MNWIKSLQKKHSCEILLAVCCAVSCGAILSLLAKEASSGDASAAAVLTKVLIDSVFCLAFSFCLYQLLVSSFKEKETVLIVPLQVQELLNDPVASEMCVAPLKTMFPNANEEHIKYQLQEFIHDSQFAQLYNQSLFIFSLIGNQTIGHRLQFCNASQLHLQEHKLD
ncbi:MAG: hypothetical protein sL5_06720 [Candidatus Mesenet longicola]|uniref:Uncharacterized protein n=1 Tax=Candidatus Mesenet longicola TaxID=1892558 RepID=A0A8J3HPG7_9RICK|nr:MAG: hypothetical protein sGL2_04370 [Candidatus Mesenet longicola]GHM59679.1 MAG: hypothetical protein sL5_06720 [Candidatus Mesenet longicola]